MAAQVPEQAFDRRVVLHTTAITHRPRVGVANRTSPVQAADEDPHLQWVQRRWILVTALQRVEQLQPHPLRQASQGELVSRDPGLLLGHPRGQVVVGERSDMALTLQALAVEPAQPSPADALATTAGHQTGFAAPQRSGAGDELVHQPAAGSAPGTLVPEAQAAAV